MTKEELIRYLDAVCAAETGIIACDGAISIYQRELRGVTDSGGPLKPQLEKVEPPAPVEKKKVVEYYKYNSMDYILEALKWPIILPPTLSELLTGDPTMLGCVGIPMAISALISSLVVHPLLFVAMYLLGCVVCYFASKAENKKRDQEQEANRLAAEQEYEAACRRNMAAYEGRKAAAESAYKVQMQVYNRKMDMYHAELKVVNDTRETIRSRIHQQETFRAELKKRLEQLYAKDVLYPNFRTLIAAYQIREYLKMGMCEELTGPTGAYAVYMNDVRTARVCDSIHELQRNLVSAIGGLQSTLALELQSVQHQLGSLEQGLHANLQGITSQMQEMHRDYRLGSDTTNYCLEQANQRLARIQSGTDSIAINQYMANLKAGANAYFPPV